MGLTQLKSGDLLPNEVSRNLWVLQRRGRTTSGTRLGRTNAIPLRQLPSANSGFCGSISASGNLIANFCASRRLFSYVREDLLKAT